MNMEMKMEMKMNIKMGIKMEMKMEITKKKFPFRCLLDFGAGKYRSLIL